ncbi:MAG: threonine ammonia-lyase [Chloroflexi bacterium]|nr:threonine ammonia-lyase [Chloroflexota bacterium]
MIGLGQIEAARAIVAEVAHRTPCLPSRSLGEMVGCRLLLKAENLQRTGSFKVRGASVKIAHLTARQRERGVIAASAGNHAQGVALAARRAGVPCTVVMPQGASLAKVAATESYGARVLFHGATFDEAMAYAQEQAREGGLTLVHAFDDEEIIAGQGTIGLELAEEALEADLAIVPVGGGGLIAGISLALKERRPSVQVIGVQVQAAPATARSFAHGRRRVVTPGSTLADGIAIGHPGVLPFQLIKRYVDDIVTVPEEEVAKAMVLLLERAKLLVEGAGATPLAALLAGAVQAQGKTVVALLSGGNVDPLLLSRVFDHGLAHAGRFLLLEVVLLDRPGQLAALLARLAEAGVNVLDIVHHRRSIYLPVGQVEVEITVETRDARHVAEVARLLEEAGYRRAGAAPSVPVVPVRLRFIAQQRAGAS